MMIYLRTLPLKICKSLSRKVNKNHLRKKILMLSLRSQKRILNSSIKMLLWSPASREYQVDSLKSWKIMYKMALAMLKHIKMSQVIPWIAKTKAILLTKKEIQLKLNLILQELIKKLTTILAIHWTLNHRKIRNKVWKILVLSKRDRKVKDRPLEYKKLI